MSTMLLTALSWARAEVFTASIGYSVGDTAPSMIKQQLELHSGAELTSERRRVAFDLDALYVTVKIKGQSNRDLRVKGVEASKIISDTSEVKRLLQEGRVELIDPNNKDKNVKWYLEGEK